MLKWSVLFVSTAQLDFFVSAVYFRRHGHFITPTSSGRDKRSRGQLYSSVSGCDVCLSIFQVIYAPLVKICSLNYLRCNLATFGNTAVTKLYYWNKINYCQRRIIRSSWFQLTLPRDNYDLDKWEHSPTRLYFVHSSMKKIWPYPITTTCPLSIIQFQPVLKFAQQ